MIGSYVLASIDGRALPVAGVSIHGAGSRVLSGSFVFNADGTCGLTETVLVDEEGGARTLVTQASCTYEDLGAGRLDLRWLSGETPGALQGVSYDRGVVAYPSFHNAREYRRIRP